MFEDMPTHTSTPEWQSFENRMRHRRALRCRLRAHIAIEAGHLDAARIALEEARRLEPVAAETTSIERRLNMAEAAALPGTPAPVPVASTRMRRPTVVIASLLLTVSALAWLAPTRRPTDSASSAFVTIEEVQVVADAIGEDAPVTRPVESRVDDLHPVGTTSQPVLPSSSTMVEATPLQTSNPALRIPTPESGLPSPDPAISRTSEASVSRSTELPISRPTDGAVARAPEIPIARALTLPSGPGSDLPSSRVPEPPTARVAESSVAVPAIETRAAAATSRDEPREAANTPDRDDARVRSVLARYEAAYSALDTVAAQSVWPGVDGHTLARAFDGLESQRVSLGRCDIVVQGSSARADCAGTATWTPKVGSGPRTEARRWTFELANAGADWRIVQVRAR
jgi:hypothetical protein